MYAYRCTHTGQTRKAAREKSMVEGGRRKGREGVSERGKWENNQKE
jgi:hypothetical protein